MKKQSLSIFTVAALMSATVALSSCKDDPDPIKEKGAAELEGSISDARTLSADTVYNLTGPLIVEQGGKLTIPAGTTIEASAGYPSYILVAQGAQIFVNGTAENPVTMTSGKSVKDAMDWGGLIINGYAPLSGTVGTRTAEINADYVYGGSKANDNSGSITYLKLEYTGAKNTADVEHNGLTLNAVGSATKIENVFVNACGDDGIEFFGGSVSVTNLLCVNTDDDMFDMTDGWNGTLKNAYGIWEQGFASSESDPSGVEADGNMDGLTPDVSGQSNFTIQNMTIVNNGVDMNNVIKVRRGATATIVNALVTGSGTVKSSGFVVDMSDSKGNGATASNISITNTMSNAVTAQKITDGTFPNVVVNPATANTGCDKGLFSWTGYQF